MGQATRSCNVDKCTLARIAYVAIPGLHRPRTPARIRSHQHEWVKWSMTTLTQDPKWNLRSMHQVEYDAFNVPPALCMGFTIFDPVLDQMAMKRHLHAPWLRPSMNTLRVLIMESKANMCRRSIEHRKGFTREHNNFWTTERAYWR